VKPEGTTVPTHVDIFGILSERPKRSTVSSTYQSETLGFQPRRHQRKLRGESVDDAILIDLDQKFEPTAEMIALREKIMQAQARAVAFYGAMMAKPAKNPNFVLLGEFRMLMSDVAYLELRYDETALKARQEFDTKRAAEAEKFAKHEESSSEPLRFQFKNPSHNHSDAPEHLRREFKLFIETLDEERRRTSAKSAIRKLTDKNNRRRKRENIRRSWIDRLTGQILATARTAYVEDELDDQELFFAQQLAVRLRRAKTLNEAAKTAYTEDLIDEEELAFYRKIGL
jgi:hypothetical protein